MCVCVRVCVPLDVARKASPMGGGPQSSSGSVPGTTSSARFVGFGRSVKGLLGKEEAKRP